MVHGFFHREEYVSVVFILEIQKIPFDEGKIDTWFIPKKDCLPANISSWKYFENLK